MPIKSMRTRVRAADKIAASSVGKGDTTNEISSNVGRRSHRKRGNEKLDNGDRQHDDNVFPSSSKKQRQHKKCDDHDTPPPPPSSSSSEDDKQYMMLRHSDDDDDDDDDEDNKTRHANSSNDLQHSKARAMETEQEAKTVATMITTNDSIARIDAESSLQLVLPANVIRQVSSQQQQQQHPSSFSSSVQAAPSWGSATNDHSDSCLLTRRVGTFDYGDINMIAASASNVTEEEKEGEEVGMIPISPAIICSQQGVTMTVSASASSTATDSSISSAITSTNLITPAQQERKVSSFVTPSSPVQQQHQQQYHQYLFPPSSPIRASSLCGEKESSTVDGGRLPTSMEKQAVEDANDLVIEGQYHKKGTEDYPCITSTSDRNENNIHKDYSKDEDDIGDHQTSVRQQLDKNCEGQDDNDKAAEEDGDEEEELAEEWLPPRRGNGGGRDAQRNNSTNNDWTPRSSRPPREASETSQGFRVPEATTGGVHSPSSPPIPQGGRVQLVGGDQTTHHQYHPQVIWRDNSLKGGGDHPLPPILHQRHESASPWSVVSRSRSTESHGSMSAAISRGGSSFIGVAGDSGGMRGDSSAEWDPPRPTRHPMIPPPGKPNSILAGGQRAFPPQQVPPPPSPYHQHHGNQNYYSAPHHGPYPYSPYYSRGVRGEEFSHAGEGDMDRITMPPPPPSIQKSSSSLSSAALSSSSFPSPRRHASGTQRGREEVEIGDTRNIIPSTMVTQPPSSVVAEERGEMLGHKPPPSSFYPPSPYPQSLPPHRPDAFSSPHDSNYPYHYFTHYPSPHHYPSHIPGMAAARYHATSSSVIPAPSLESPRYYQDPIAHPLLRDYNPHQDGYRVQPQFQNIKKMKKNPNKTKSSKKDGDITSLSTRPVISGGKGDVLMDDTSTAVSNSRPGYDSSPPFLVSTTTAGTTESIPPMRRKRRRCNPTEKAALAARMAAEAAAALREKNARKSGLFEGEGPTSTTTKGGEGIETIREEQDNIDESPLNTGVVVDGGCAGEKEGVRKPFHNAEASLHETSPFSEEELKTLGSGDDEDIPASRRAAMASAVALRAAAGGSPVEPPKSASEVNFDIANPPLLPILPPSMVPVLSSATLMTENDVLCGRGGGTNSQTGNRRFRALVRDFQPTYLMAKRREKPRMARSVVLIVRHRGGRFLRRDDTDGRLYEVGDEKAEAKTSQALREGLDVRATKTAANTLMSSSYGGGCSKMEVSSMSGSGTTNDKNDALVIMKGRSKSSMKRSTPSAVSVQRHDPVFSQHVTRTPYAREYNDPFNASHEYRGAPMNQHIVPGAVPPPPVPQMYIYPHYTLGGPAATGGFHYPTTSYGGVYIDSKTSHPPIPPRQPSRGGGDVAIIPHKAI